MSVPSLIVTDVSDLQLEKAFEPIFLTDAGITTFCRLGLLEKAFDPISTTGQLSPMVAGISATAMVLGVTPVIVALPLFILYLYSGVGADCNLANFFHKLCC